MNAITVRQMAFDFPDRIDPLIVPGDPEEAYVNVGLSLLLPYLEPYLIRTMKAARPHVRDPELVEDLERFSAQEGVHYRQHRRFNDAVKRFGFPGLDALETELDADYRRFSAERPVEWNLAYAEGFEALTTAAAHASFVTGIGMDDDVDPWFRDLMRWHLLEELEHRTVAFDVYQHVHGRYLYRLRVGTWAQWHMAQWIGRAARHMLEHDERTRGDRRRTPAIRARKRRRMRRTLRHVLPRLLKTYLPGYSPRRIRLPDEIHALAAEYTARAVRVS